MKKLKWCYFKNSRHTRTHIYSPTYIFRSFQAVTYISHSSTAGTLVLTTLSSRGHSANVETFLEVQKGVGALLSPVCRRETHRQTIPGRVAQSHNKELATPSKLSRAARKETLGSHRRHRRLHKLLQELDYGGLLGPEK